MVVGQAGEGCAKHLHQDRLSLMAEYLGLAYYAEVPLVVWDVQRVGRALDYLRIHLREI